MRGKDNRLSTNIKGSVHDYPEKKKCYLQKQ